MRLANKPAEEVEAFQQQSSQCLQHLQNDGEAVAESNGASAPTDLKRIECLLSALADDLRRRNEQVIPNQISALEAVLKQHKVSFLNRG